MVNALNIMVSVAFLYATVLACRGLMVANRLLVLCALNPLYYGLVCWVYSLTFSLPIMMGSLYVGLRIHRAKGKASAVAWAALEGLLFVLGFEIRPTACFPAVAMAIVAVRNAVTAKGSVRSQALRRLAVVALSGCIATACCLGVASTVKHKYFYEVEGGSYPVTFWLSMGSHGKGNNHTNGADHRLVKSLPQDERFGGMLRNTLNNYMENGMLGTLGLWGSKMLRTWSNGYACIYNRANNNESGSSLAYELLGGGYRDIYAVWCHASRLLAVLGVVVVCLRAVRLRGVGESGLTLGLMLTLLGGIVFYWLWEAKVIYSAPFVPVMLPLASEGWEHCGRLVSSLAATARPSVRRLAIGGLTMVMLCSVAMIGVYASTAWPVSFSLIRSNVSNRIWSRREFSSEIRQKLL